MESRTVVLALPVPEDRKAIARAFAAAGWEPVEAGDAGELAGPLVARPDAVVVDLALGGKGLGGDRAPAGESELLRALHARFPAAAIFVRATTALSLDELFAAGARDVFEPAVDPRVLVRRASQTRLAASVEPQCTGPTDFMARITERLARVRDREGNVPVFVVRVPGAVAPAGEDLRSAIAEAAQRVEDSTELSVSASRVATMPVGDGGTAIFVPDLVRVQDAARFATAFRAALSARVGSAIHMGVACSPTDGADAATLVAHAHAASRRALRDGQAELVFHAEAMGRWAFERLTLEANLRSALQRGELALYYQPRVDTTTREIQGMEALLRWIHPQFGIVSPAQFIPLAEETGLIVPIGEWIVGEAARQNLAWRKEGLPPIRVSVNLSPVQFRRSDLFDTITAAVTASGLEPSALELEVTESLLMNDPTQTAHTLRRFKEFGLAVSIDDFGTGYSSLSYLKRFPIDALKIDRSFVTDVTSNPDDAAIATAIILMGHSLKLKVVAEGVETESQLAFLRVLQCNEAQGYLFSPPVPADKAGELLAGHRFRRRAAA